jgi:hypothetical protein
VKSETADPESWAREHIHWVTSKRGHTGICWVAQIRVDGLVFEGQAEGHVRQREALRRRAEDAAVRDYMDFARRTE